MPAAPVLDSFALLAFLRSEPGEDQVAALLERAGERDAPLHMTEVNYAEVKSMVIRKDGAARWAEIEPELPTLPIGSFTRPTENWRIPPQSSKPASELVSLTVSSPLWPWKEKRNSSLAILGSSYWRRKLGLCG